MQRQKPLSGDDVVSTRIRFHGDLDLATAPAARAQVLAVFAAGGDGTVEVDLRGVDFVDSSGIGVLVGVVRRARARAADVRFRVRPGTVRDVLFLVGIDRIVDVVTETEADQ